MTRSLRILYFDVEISPEVVFRWPNQEWIPHYQVINHQFMFCWGAAWSDQKQLLGAKLTPEEVAEQDDSRIAAELAALVVEADYVLAYNGDRFDVKKLNNRLVYHRLEPMGPVQTIDPLKLVKRDLGLSHNSLDAVLAFLQMEGKLKTDFSLWTRAYYGDEVAMQQMLRYCRRDVDRLRAAFEELLPYFKKLPRLVFGDGSYCTNCGSTDFQKRGFVYSAAGRKQQYKCNNCARYFSDKASDAGKSQMRPS